MLTWPTTFFKRNTCVTKTGTMTRKSVTCEDESQECTKLLVRFWSRGNNNWLWIFSAKLSKMKWHKNYPDSHFTAIQTFQTFISEFIGETFLEVEQSYTDNTHKCVLRKMLIEEGSLTSNSTSIRYCVHRAASAQHMIHQSPAVVFQHTRKAVDSQVKRLRHIVTLPHDGTAVYSFNFTNFTGELCPWHPQIEWICGKLCLSFRGTLLCAYWNGIRPETIRPCKSNTFEGIFSNKLNLKNQWLTRSDMTWSTAL